jgi:hypothetical protein
MNVFVRDKAVLEVPGKARVAGGVNAFRNRPPQQSLSVGGLDDVKRGPTTMAGGEPFYVCCCCYGIVGHSERLPFGWRASVVVVPLCVRQRGWVKTEKLAGLQPASFLRTT